VTSAAYHVLGAFSKLHKAIISFAMYVCPSTWNNWTPGGWIFIKFDILSICRKSIEEIQV
jgi:hypothetical protein